MCFGWVDLGNRGVCLRGGVRDESKDIWKGGIEVLGAKRGGEMAEVEGGVWRV